MNYFFAQILILAAGFVAAYAFSLWALIPMGLSFVAGALIGYEGGVEGAERKESEKELERLRSMLGEA